MYGAGKTNSSGVAGGRGEVQDLLKKRGCLSFPTAPTPMRNWTEAGEFVWYDPETVTGVRWGSWRSKCTSEKDFFGG